MLLQDFAGANRPAPLTIVDISWPVSAVMPLWPGDPATEVEAWTSLTQEGYFLNRLSIGEHNGTHLGSPKHYLADGKAMADVKPQSLLAPAIKINCRSRCRKEPEYRIDLADIERWEQRFGPIPPHHWLLIETGWSRYWNSDPPTDYWQTFPGVTGAAAEFLCAKRKILGIGIDSAGVDGSAGQDFAVGRCLASLGRLHLENLCRLQPLPGKGILIFIGALAIVNGSGSPCRVMALFPQQRPR